MLRILHGDCLTVLSTLEANSIDAVVTDPPYGLEFMGKEWDGADGFRRSLNAADVGRDNAFGRTSARAPEYRAGHLFEEWCECWGRECLRVLKPGGHLVAFGGSRTYHRLASGIEDAGFEIRDQLQWLYGQGFPKHRSALKPGHEPIVLARKPLIGSVIKNVERWGTGTLNIDGCRIAGKPWKEHVATGLGSVKFFSEGDTPEILKSPNELGRWPANVIHDGSDEVVAMFPHAPGQMADVKRAAGELKTSNVYGKMNREGEASADNRYTDNGSTNFAATPGQRRTDSGSAARFFYCAKATKKERAGSKHPTVKPLALMRYLCRLVTPPGGIVLDPFAGSGTTAQAARDEGFNCVLIEREQAYITDILARIGTGGEWLAQAIRGA